MGDVSMKSRMHSWQSKGNGTIGILGTVHGKIVRRKYGTMVLP